MLQSPCIRYSDVFPVETISGLSGDSPHVRMLVVSLPDCGRPERIATGSEQVLPLGSESATLQTSTVPKTTSKDRRPTDRLALLGHSAEETPSKPTPGTLETFINAYSKRDYWIRFESRDFTSLCPVTGHPDFARITINYVPDKTCIETKSLKFYLASFRNTRSFNEEIVNRVLEDLVTACSP